jgi:fructokinase
MLAAGAYLFVITPGSRGAQVWHHEAGAVEVATIGAGDSFQGALLFALHAIGRIRPSSLAGLTVTELRGALSFALHCAAFTCCRAGADPPPLY